jgi:dihydropyrimidine dehydrogenase (NAD+) subunit PreA
VELIALEKLAEMPLTEKEFAELLEHGFEISGRTRVTAIHTGDGRVTGLATRKVELPAGEAFHPRLVRDLPGTDQERPDIQAVIVSIGSRPSRKDAGATAVFLAGDMENGPTTVVEAVAAGKNAARRVTAFLQQQPPPVFERNVKSRVRLAGRNLLPVPLNAEFFGRPILSPFLLSAAPPTDGYAQMKKAYEAGWAGGVIKTAFDGVPIHIPAEYMFAFNATTYANCDNVSDHPLDRVCREVEQLRREFPDRLTLASTGGPVTGDDEADRHGWQANTRKLESAGVMGIEYSLSCPQGGDGTKGDIVSQDAELTARIIDWVLQASNPEVPKLFKLTAAVTAIQPIILAIREVFDRYPAQKAGITLANTFPTLALRKGVRPQWEEGIVVGMSGEGVTPISNLTLARVSRLGVTVSGNGGPMDYKAAAHFLALGARTVQFCTIVMKHGYGIIEELHSGLSHLLEARGIPSVDALIGRALPDPVTDFMALSAVKKISAVNAELCEHCGNCTRCPYLAVSLNADKVPETDPARCIGCSICAQKCFSGALYMRERTPDEARALAEGGEA